MNIEEIVNKINNKEATRSEIGESLGMSNTSLSRKIKDAGYVYDNSTKTYSLTSPNPEIKKESIQGNKETKKKESNPSNKQEKKEIRKMETQEKSYQENQEERKVKKKVTYELDENLHWELRMEAFKHKKNVSDLVEQAIKTYLKERK